MLIASVSWGFNIFYGPKEHIIQLVKSNVAHEWMISERWAVSELWGY